MLIKDMQPGKTVDILIDREGINFRFVSKVEAVNGSTVAVSLIAVSGRVFRFEDGDNITLIYRLPERMWKWDRVKGGLAKLEGQAVHTLFSAREAVPYNRRDAFRVPIGENYVMRKVVKHDQGETQEIMFDALLADLSAGGAGIYTNKEFDNGTEIVFDLPTNLGIINCRGNVVRGNEVYDRPQHNFYGIAFYETKGGLEKYLFEKQRLSLQKERGG